MDFEQVDWEWVVEELKKEDIGFIRPEIINKITWELFEKQSSLDNLAVKYTNDYVMEFIEILILSLIHI